MRRLKRANKILTRRLRLIHRPSSRHLATVVSTHPSDLQKITKYVATEKSSPWHTSNLARLTQAQSRTVCSSFRRVKYYSINFTLSCDNKYISHTFVIVAFLYYSISFISL